MVPEATHVPVVSVAGPLGTPGSWLDSSELGSGSVEPEI